MNTYSSVARGILVGVFALAAAPALAQTSSDPAGWSGSYASVFGMESSSRVSGESKRGDGNVGTNAASESAEDSFRGAGAGLLLGYQREFPTGIVVGLEADWGWLHQEGRQDTIVTANNAWNGMTQASILRETRWLSTARLRLGYANGPFMVNITGGLAMASLNETRTQYEGVSGPNQTMARFSDSDHATPIGWTLGIGAAWRVSGAWSLRMDYLHTQFDSVRFSFPDARGGVVSGSGFASVQGRSVENDVTMQTLRIGVTYRFGAAP